MANFVSEILNICELMTKKKSFKSFCKMKFFLRNQFFLVNLRGKIEFVLPGSTTPRY